MKRLLTLLALVLCSCAETFVGEEVARPNNGNLPDLTAAFAEEDNTRTYIEDGKYLRWHEDDRLTIFFGNTLNRQYKFNGATGDNSGTFSLVPDGMLGTGNAFDHIYALYPYNADARITDEGIISLTLPAEQTYAENSFGRGANTMIAVTENVEDTFLAFKNACGYLKIKLYNAEGATIKSIEVKGNSGERLAGAATATIAFGEAPVLAMADDATTSVTLDCGEGVALGTTAETATEFWVTLPATTFAEGLTITATDTEGGVFEKSTTNEVIIERNAIQPMAVLEAEFVATKPANNEIWYTNDSTTEPTNTRDAFDVNIVSNTYDAEKECWVIKFDGDVITIRDDAFYYCRSLTSVAIPDSVTTIGEWAFYHCDSLTSVTIGDSVTTIGNYAFSGCSSLTSVTIPDSVTTIGNYAFNGCRSLISMTIPDSVTTIGDCAFLGCRSLRKFNGKYASEDGRCLIIDDTLNSFAPAGLTEYTIPDSVTTIGNYAFYSCSSLTSVTIPDSVTTIGGSAFSGCSSLTSVTIPDGVTTIGGDAFYYCRSLTSVAIPDSVTTIGEEAFWDCSSLTSVTIGDSVTEIGYRAFFRCDSLTSVTIGDSVTTIGREAFSDCSSLTSVTIGDSVTTIGYGAFSDCSSLTSVTIPDSVTTIGEWAFSDCSSLTSVTIPYSVTTIGDYAFAWCCSLTSVTIPDSVTTIGEWAFWYCSSLTSVYITDLSAWCRISFEDSLANPLYNAGNLYLNNELITDLVIPSDVTEIKNYAFYNCSNLTSVTIPDSVTTIGEEAFAHCDSLTSVTIPDSVTEIGENAFGYCNSLTRFNGKYASEDGRCLIVDGTLNSFAPAGLAEYTIPDSVTTIGDSAFRSCNSLINVTISDSVTTIGEEAFAYCSSLTSVTIGDSVTTIGEDAFLFCSSLTSVYCKAITPPAVGAWMFSSNAIIYVPAESVEAYKSAEGWSSYKSYIVGYDF